jgi:hypothetical protein
MSVTYELQDNLKTCLKLVERKTLKVSQLSVDANPTQNLQVATKNYVDSSISSFPSNIINGSTNTGVGGTSEFVIGQFATPNNVYLVEINLLSCNTSDLEKTRAWKLTAVLRNGGNSIFIDSVTSTSLYNNSAGGWNITIGTLWSGFLIQVTGQIPARVDWAWSATVVGLPYPYSPA